MTLDSTGSYPNVFSQISSNTRSDFERDEVIPNDFDIVLLVITISYLRGDVLAIKRDRDTS